MSDTQKSWLAKLSVGFFLTLFIAIIFIIAVGFLVTYVHKSEKKMALVEAEQKTRIILDRNMAIHSYFNKVMKPKLFEVTDLYLTEDYFEPSWMSSTYAVREIDKLYKSTDDTDYYYKEAAINARSPENEADEFEKAFIEEFNNDPQLKFYSEVRKLDGQYFLVTLRRGEVLEEGCLRCHSTPDKSPKGLVDTYGPERSFKRNLGEVIDVISIRVPLSEAYAKADQMTRDLGLALLGTFFFLLLCQFLLYKLIIGRPLKRLFDQTSLISESDAHLGEQIPLPPTIEFNKLTATFNLMSKRLRNQIDNLEDTIVERTSELTTTNENLQKEIIERKQAQEELVLQSEIATNMVEGVYLIRFDDLIIVYANPMFEQMFGYDPGEMIGRHASMVSAPTEKKPEKTAAEIMEVLGETGEWHGEVKNIKKDGTPFWCFANVSLFAHSKYGKVLVSVHSDITKRKEMEDELRKSELQKTQLLNSAGDGIYGIDTQGNTTFVNPAAQEMLGYKAEEIVGLNNHTLLHHTKADGSPYPEAECRMLAAIEQDRKILITDEVLWRKDGTSFPVEYSSTPIRNDGDVLGTVIVFSDITERIEQEEHLRQIETNLQQLQKSQSLNSMAAGIAHNFNNILAAVIGNQELALESMPAHQKERNYIEAAFNASQRAAKLSTMMLQFVGQGTADMRPFEVTALLGEIIEILKSQIQSQITLSSKSADEIIGKGDIGMIRQVIVNLVTNADESIVGEDGQISIQSGQRFYSTYELKQPHIPDGLPEGEYVYLTVSDNGLGMDKETLARVFDPFFTTKFTGRGMGLPVILGIMRSHKGTVFLKSKLGKGTTVTVLFPALAPQSLPAEKTPKATPAKVNLTGTVLVVDDEQMLREFEQAVLTQIGFEVLQAADGLEALEVFERNVDGIDLVLLDIAMPGLNGLSVLKIIREKSMVPVIMATGYSIEQISDQFNTIANVSLIQKPFTLQELRSKIQEMILPVHN